MHLRQKKALHKNMIEYTFIIMNKIKKLEVFTCFLILLMLQSKMIFASTKDDRPNIIWIMAENIGTELGCYGAPDVKTPNLDNMADKGTLFTSAFTTAPVCSPSRAAMMTGVHQIRTNTQNLRMNTSRELPEPYRAITHYFRKAGYFTALGCGFSGKTDINFQPREGKIDGFDGRDWKQRKKGQPFFAQITLNITHRGNHWYSNTPDLVPYPKMDHYRAPIVYIPGYKDNIDAGEVVLPQILPDHPVVRDDWARYLTQIQKMDIQVGEIVQRLKDEGIYDNTMIVFISDNGLDHYRGEYWLYDRGIQVPMIIKWPKSFSRCEKWQRCDDLVSAIDISATVLDIAGIQVPDHFDGVSFIRPENRRKYIYAARDRIDSRVERIRCVRSLRYKYIRNYRPEIGYLETEWVMINNPSLNVIHNLYLSGNLTPSQSLHMNFVKPKEELYDLHEDPLELNNLANSVMHASVLREMRGLLDGWIEDTGDTGQFPEKREDAQETIWFNYDEVYGSKE